ncbi:hypothetical protein O7599_23540 [Streptomyces sp. WMMC500]|uniref:hypothetical protein n=1 Tax=Streptomyces sp. WMMC500 TaxID=3015154 RepID=UPI00248AB146|nr:hypothetical protein [Streptomyces sp. WMMC500]WBB58588.1 hypothetical protein O7599_23540 [Streptomyces sp. WMMC500]
MRKATRSTSLVALAVCATLAVGSIATAEPQNERAPRASAKAAAAPNMVIDSLSGAVTANEINSFYNYVNALTPPTSNLDNRMAYSNTGGRVAEALGMMYEISGQTRVLDKLLQWTDTFLAARNNPSSGRVLFTGKRELAWPNKAATAADAKYSGTENGDVMARIAYAAKLILQRPALWNTTVPDGNPKGFGATYRARAERYVRELDRTMDTFITPHFIRTANNHMHFPDTDAWGALGPRYENDRGFAVPWNQQTMLSGAYQRLAECHEILGDDPARVTRYDNIVASNIRWFLSDVTPRTVQGQRVYDWGYGLSRTGEDTGHGAYDILGLYRAYTRSKYGVSKAHFDTFGRTEDIVINSGPHLYTKYVDGTGGTQNWMNGEWLFLAATTPSVYNNIAASNTANGRSKQNAMIHASILWIKKGRNDGRYPK